ncbi:MAG: site-specific integrase [Burkholderiaceae bacterium]|nr:site-specific integrase [Burkholderiaceae bacterium]
MDAEFFVSATAMLRAAAAGIHYHHIAAAHGVTKSTVSNRVRRLALALQQVVGVLEIDEDTSPSASLLRNHQEAYLEALEHFRPGAVPAHFEPPQTLTSAQVERLLTKIRQHSHAPLRDKALLLALLSTGAKPLEIAQLTVQDYMDAAGQVRTHSILRAVIATNHADRPLQFNCPDTVAAIDAYLAERSAKQLSASTGQGFRGFDPASRLFLSRDGHPMKITHPDNRSRRTVCKEMHEIYRRIFNHAGLTGLNTACARRMAASRMLAQGAAPQDIGHALGVKSAAVHQLLKTANATRHAPSL